MDNLVLAIVVGAVAIPIIYTYYENRKFIGARPIGFVELLIATPNDPITPAKKLYGEFAYGYDFVDSESFQQLEKLGVKGASELRDMLTQQVRGVRCINCSKWIDDPKYPIREGQEKCSCQIPTRQFIEAQWSAYIVDAVRPTDPRYMGLNLVISPRPIEDRRYHQPVNTRGKFPGIKQTIMDVRAVGDGGRRRVRDEKGRGIVPWFIIPEVARKGGFDLIPGELSKFEDYTSTVIEVRRAARNSREIEAQRQEKEMWKNQNQKTIDEGMETNADNEGLRRYLLSPDEYQIGIEKTHIRTGTTLSRLQKYMIAGAILGALVAYFLGPTYLSQYESNTRLLIGLAGGIFAAYIYVSYYLNTKASATR